MPNVSACPDLSLFEKLGRDGLGESQKQELLEHLEGCAACADRVSTLPCDDTLVDLIRQADTLGRQPAAPEACRLVEQIRRLLPEQPEPHAATLNVRVAGVAHSGEPKPRTDPDLLGFLAPPQRPDELGRLGPYRALEVLGSGGMGVVFRAEDTKLRRQVALKAILPALASSSSSKERFLREARAAASVKHDHVVTIHQVNEDQGVPFIAMEFLEGESLEQRLARHKTPALPEILRIGREIAEGLAAAHDLGLVHRDIKPANIWLEARANGSFRVKILDFGLARGGDEDRRLTQKGVIIGTPAYMCPEQAAGRTTDARSDLFSLGCVLYEMCAGELPFSGTDVISTLVAVAAQPPRQVQDLNPALPKEFADLVMQLLHKDPEDRPQSARAVAERLARLEEGKSVPVGRGRGRGREKPRRRRTPILWGVAAAIILLAGGGVWLASVILRIETAHGTVVLKTDDNDIQVRVRQGGKEVVIIDPKTSKEITLKVGDYDVELVQPKPGLRLKSDHFSLLDGDRKVVEVRFEPKDEGHRPELAKKPPPPKDSPPGPKKPPKVKGGLGPPPDDGSKKGPKAEPASTKQVSGLAFYVPPTTNEKSILLQAQAYPSVWKRLTGKYPDVKTGRCLVSLPGARSEVETKSGIWLTLWGYLPELYPVPVLESVVELHDNNQKGLDLDMTFYRGRIVLINSRREGPARVRLRYENPTVPGSTTEFMDLILMERGSKVLLERWSLFQSTEKFFKDPWDPNRLGPIAEMGIIGLAGDVILQANDREFALEARPGKGPPAAAWSSQRKGLTGPHRMEKLPPWISTNPPLPEDTKQADQDIRLRSDMIHALQDLSTSMSDKTVGVALREAVTSADSAPRRYAVRCFAALDDFENLVEALDQDSKADVRQEAITSLQMWIASSRNVEYRLYDYLKKKYTASEAFMIMDLLHPYCYSPEARSQPATYEALIKNLNNDLMVIRELSSRHLNSLINLKALGRPPIPYDAVGPPAFRREAQEAWERLIPRGKLPLQPTGK